MASGTGYILILLLVQALPSYCLPAVAQFTNFPVPIPFGLNATQHGNSKTFCIVPAPWTSVIVFYLGNYAAHAATVITYPGEAPFSTLVAIVYALFFPTSGIVRGLNAIARHFRWPSLPWKPLSDLEKAARAGALCMVVRTTKWKPADAPMETHPGIEMKQGYEKAQIIMTQGAWCQELLQLWPFFDTSLERPEIENHDDEGHSSWFFRAWETLTRTERKIHGTCRLPSNGYYALAYVPRHAKISGKLAAEGFDKSDSTLSSSHSVLRSLVAIVQVLYASVTLYKATRGPQVKQYGYAAFGLTVVPYLIMSLINFVANAMAPVYDTLYLVHSDVLAEAQERFPEEARFDGAIGALQTEGIEEPIRVKVDKDLIPALQEAVNSPLLTDNTVASVFPRQGDDYFTVKPPSKSKTLELPLSTKRVTWLHDVPGSNASDSKYGVVFTHPRFERIHEDKLPCTSITRPWSSWDKYVAYILSKKSSLLSISSCLRRDQPPQEEQEEDEPLRHVPRDSWLFFTFFTLLVGSLSLIPVGIISKFRENKSTHEQRVWILCWMVFGFVIGTVAELFVTQWRHNKSKTRVLVKLFFALVFAAPGVGGYVMVAQMLREYGNCTTLY